MTEEEFVGLVGERLSHVTLAENLPGIAMHGLLRPSALARLAKVDARSLVLRDERTQLKLGKITARLNSQGALRFGIRSASQFLDGHTIESWSEQLDSRVFFWSERDGSAFEQSHDENPTAKFVIDARAFFAELGPQIDLAPINTGAARRKPARRGDWIYVPATGPAEAFRMNRVARGLKKSPDTVSEISVRADIPADQLARMRIG